MAWKNHVPRSIRGLYLVREWKHACAILKHDFFQEWKDIMTVLREFRLLESDVRAPGGGKSRVSQRLDTRFKQLGWGKKSFATAYTIDTTVLETQTHEVDLFKNRVALEVEWNNKDTFYDRDLDNFRHLFDLNVISLGVVITRASELQALFDTLREGGKYGASTTHLNKLLPKADRGGAGGCPLLVFAITRNLYVARK